MFAVAALKRGARVSMLRGSDYHNRDKSGLTAKLTAKPQSLGATEGACRGGVAHEKLSGRCAKRCCGTLYHPARLASTLLAATAHPIRRLSRLSGQCATD